MLPSCDSVNDSPLCSAPRLSASRSSFEEPSTEVQLEARREPPSALPSALCPPAILPNWTGGLRQLEPLESRCEVRRELRREVRLDVRRDESE
eukprot:3129779-Pleurochrysis_carterae.AAC.2